MLVYASVKEISIPFKDVYFFTQFELSLILDALFFFKMEIHRHSRPRRLFISGPFELERVGFCEVRKFFIAEANRLLPQSVNSRYRYHINFVNPVANINGMLESDIVDVLKYFRHRQFIFANFDKSDVNVRFVNYFDRLIFTDS